MSPILSMFLLICDYKYRKEIFKNKIYLARYLKLFVILMLSAGSFPQTGILTNQFSMSKNLLLAIIIPLFLIVSGCNKNENDIIPNVRFHVVLNLDDPRYAGNLFEVYYVPDYGYAGLKGIVVYQYDRNRYLAFDLVCPHEGDRLVKVVRSGNSDFYVCPECQSKYHINVEYGVVEGVSKWPLKMYSTSYDEVTNHLTIRN